MPAEPDSARRWSNTNSHQLMKAYDKSPVASPPLSRNNSNTSIKSTQSEPAWKHDRHESRKDSNASTQTTQSHKKGGLMSIFSSKEKKPKEKKDVQKIVLGSRHAAAVKTKMMMEQHAAKNTTGTTQRRSSHSTAAEQEARHPHSGPPAMHASINTPLLTRIESRDEPDDEIDRWEAQRREWSEAKEHNMNEIPELRSQPNSSKASPIESRDPSPNRLGTRSKHPTYAGRYHRNEAGRWTTKDVPTMTHTHSTGKPHPDALVTSLTERLNAL